MIIYEISSIVSTLGLLVSMFAVDSDCAWATPIGAVSLVTLALCGLKLYLTIQREKNDERCSLYRSIHYER